MANLRDLRQRITSVGNIQKITRAMEMVATTKLRRFQGQTVAAKPYTEEIEKLVRNLAGAVATTPESAGDAAALFSVANPDAPRAVLFLGSDRGLCGAYNSNVQRHLMAELGKMEQGAQLYVIGRKAMEFAGRMGLNVAAYLEDIQLERLTFADAVGVSEALGRAFVNGEVSGVSLCYTRFLSMVKYEPTFQDFLPIAPPEEAGEDDTILEPSGQEVLGRLIPKFLETKVFHACLESITSEYASRRFAMKNATDAAGEMKQEITRTFNKVRQQKITSEILEIVSGAEAL